jgi:hypothetical protein
MRKNTKNTAKFGKLLELIYNIKLKLVDTSHWPELCAIDEKARQLYEIYKNDSPDPNWKQRRAHGYLKFYYKQQQHKK